MTMTSDVETAKTSLSYFYSSRATFLT